MIAANTLRLEQSAAKSLFSGSILEENLFPYPELRAKDREVLGTIVDSIDEFLNDKQAEFKKWDRAAEQPADFVQGLRDMGLFGLIIPEELWLVCRSAAK